MKILAWSYLLVSILSTINMPGRQGKVNIYTSNDTVCSLLDTAVIIALVGRVLGWW